MAIVWRGMDAAETAALPAAPDAHRLWAAVRALRDAGFREASDALALHLPAHQQDDAVGDASAQEDGKIGDGRGGGDDEEADADVAVASARVGEAEVAVATKSSASAAARDEAASGPGDARPPSQPQPQRKRASRQSAAAAGATAVSLAAQRAPGSRVWGKPAAATAMPSMADALVQAKRERAGVHRSEA
jgi:hypothetical protein